MPQFGAYLTIAIYNHKIFKVQATDASDGEKCFKTLTSGGELEAEESG